MQALRGYVRSCEPGRLRSELGSIGAEVAKVVSEIRERLPDLPPSTPGDPAQERFRLFDSIATFLRNASSSQPLVVVLDNIHFADEPTLLLAQFLMQGARDSRLLLIGTYRELETGRRNPIGQLLSDLGRERNFKRMPLRGLSREESGRFVEALTGTTPSEALIRRVYDATEGVPLFIAEVVNLLTEEGRLEAPPERLEIPTSVRDVIAQRLDRLSEEAINALTLAALLGREFELAVLRELTGKSETELLELLEPAVTSRIIEAVPGSRSRYQFVHGLTRQCLTADLPTTRLVRLHGRVGEALERVYGRNAERHAAELAFHFGQAATLTDAQEKAVRYGVLAAKAAETNHAYEDAINQYQNALAIIRETGHDSSSGPGLVLGQDEILLLRALATAQRFANRVPEAFRNFRIAFRMAQERGDGQLVAELALEQDQTGFVPADLRVRNLTEGLDAVPDQESELAAMMHARIVGPLRASNRPSEAEEHRKLARGVAARKGYRKVELQVSSNDLGQAVNLLKLDQVPELEQRVEELEREVGLVLEFVPQRAGVWHLLLGDLAEARQRAARALEAMRRARRTEFLWLPLRTLGTAHYLEGGFAEMSAVLGLEERTEGSVPDTYMEMARAVLAEARGHLDESRAAVEAATRASTSLRVIPDLPREMVYLAGIERRAGNRQQAASLYRRATEEWERIRGGQPPFLVLHNAAVFALEAAAQGDASALTRCRETLEQHSGLVAYGNSMPLPVLVDRALGVVAAAEARWEDAVGYLERGEAFCQEKGLVVELAHCRMALADALMHRNPATGIPVDKSPVSDGDRRRATALYGQALADYQRLGMPLYVQDVLARREVLRA